MTQRMRRIVRMIKRIAGMPDYAAYVAHLRQAHPECAIPSERDYYRLYLQQRYDGKTTRCC